jgi:hypothetical protein
METNVAGGGYTITFIYIRDTFTIELEVFSWAVYDSMRNIWSTDNVEALDHLRDMEVFNMNEFKGYFYENVAVSKRRQK